MIDFSDSQKRTIASGATVLSFVITFAFVALLAWGLIQALAFASMALVPVLLGFFLALFFKPYYRWWVSVLKNPTLSLVVMLATVLVPLSLLLWYAGAVIIDQLSNLIAQGPTLARQTLVWFRETFPKLHELLVQMGVPYEDLGGVYTKYGSTALRAGTSALKCFAVFAAALVSIIFFVPSDIHALLNEHVAEHDVSRHQVILGATSHIVLWYRALFCQHIFYSNPRVFIGYRSLSLVIKETVVGFFGSILEDVHRRRQCRHMAEGLGINCTITQCSEATHRKTRNGT